MVKKPEWETIVPARQVQRSDSTQVGVSVTQLAGGHNPMVSMREFKQYATKAERAEGLTKDDMPYRPGDNGITFPVERLDDMITVLLAIKDDLEGGKKAEKTTRKR